jgi:DNA mismatch endonuclease (patch repair protein)
MLRRRNGQLLADIVSQEVRSRMMAGIGPANTKPELLLRRGLHALGYRYKLHDKRLPGKPDMVFPRRRAVIFVNGCFWHGHACHLFRWPSTRSDFWRTKISGNVTRDVRVREQVAARGWRIADVWECVLKGKERIPLGDVLAACAKFLEGTEPYASIGAPSTVPCPAPDDRH